MKIFQISIIALVVVAAACTPSKKKEQSTEAEAPTAQSEVTTEPTSTEPKVFFKNITEGDTVSTPVYVEMGVEGMEIKPAGAIEEGSGHHHILINQSSWPEGQVIPASDSTIHFGKGQTETQLELEAGEYTISLQFANGAHQSYGEKMAASVKVVVK